jgi:hypothetical protein
MYGAHICILIASGSVLLYTTSLPFLHFVQLGNRLALLGTGICLISFKASVHSLNKRTINISNLSSIKGHWDYNYRCFKHHKGKKIFWVTAV